MSVYVIVSEYYYTELSNIKLSLHHLTHKSKQLRGKHIIIVFRLSKENVNIFYVRYICTSAYMYKCELMCTYMCIYLDTHTHEQTQLSAYI